MASKEAQYMGQLMRAECPQCGYGVNLFVGGGRMDCDAETLLASLSEPDRNDLEAAISSGASDLSIFRRPFLCRSCGSLYAQPVVHYEWNGARQTMLGKCKTCGGSDGTDLSGTDEADHACPQCGGNISLQRVGFWD